MTAKMLLTLVASFSEILIAVSQNTNYKDFFFVHHATLLTYLYFNKTI